MFNEQDFFFLSLFNKVTVGIWKLFHLIRFCGEEEKKKINRQGRNGVK